MYTQKSHERAHGYRRKEKKRRSDRCETRYKTGRKLHGQGRHGTSRSPDRKRIKSVAISGPSSAHSFAGSSELESDDKISLHGSDIDDSVDRGSVSTTSEPSSSSSSVSSSTSSDSGSDSSSDESSSDGRRKRKHSKKRSRKRAKKSSRSKKKHSGRKRHPTKSKKRLVSSKRVSGKEHLLDLPKGAKQAVKRTTSKTKKVLDLNRAFTKEWHDLATKGIADRKVSDDLFSAYDPAVHLEGLMPPKIDNELEPRLPLLAKKRDKGLEVTQQTSARALGAIGAALTILTNHMKREEKAGGESLPLAADLSQEMYGFLWDASALLTSGFYKTSRTRRHLLSFSIAKNFRDKAKAAPLTDKLFGGEIPDWIKAAKTADAAKMITYSDLVNLPGKKKQGNQGNANRPASWRNQKARGGQQRTPTRKPGFNNHNPGSSNHNPRYSNKKRGPPTQTLASPANQQNQQ